MDQPPYKAKNFFALNLVYWIFGNKRQRERERARERQ